MFSWLTSLFSNKPKQREEAFDIYKPEERVLYHYWDGKNVHRVDPMVLYKKYLAKAGDLYADSKVASSPMKDAPKFHDSMVQKIRGIFEVEAYPNGLTEQESIDLLEHFLEFIEAVKKNGKGHQTSSGTTSPSTSAPTAPSGAGYSTPSPPTASISPSGSAEKEPTTSEPARSPSGLPSPSEVSSQGSTTTEP